MLLVVPTIARADKHQLFLMKSWCYYKWLHIAIGQDADTPLVLHFSLQNFKRLDQTLISFMGGHFSGFPCKLFWGGWIEGIIWDSAFPPVLHGKFSWSCVFRTP